MSGDLVGAVAVAAFVAGWIWRDAAGRPRARRRLELPRAGRRWLH